MDKDTTLRSPNGQMYRNQDAVDYSTDVEATKEESNHFILSSVNFKKMRLKNPKSFSLTQCSLEVDFGLFVGQASVRDPTVTYFDHFVRTAAFAPLGLVNLMNDEEPKLYKCSMLNLKSLKCNLSLIDT
ncbi:hypothetical protein JR316_0002835 [Psilocybe cubensis]|uniref:Uncharacterized protein n=1 Tax=Psilocybe cubensis TaxID=181762 RepID=A0ACB8HDC5_PSICU|nr:hypothetical protein JR316_0002835 [Psilocybe cubensis]KAH9485918.1 hypothetical protein JR316_0002835 [Psilocybe cubensis]